MNMNMRLRSDAIKTGPDHAPARAMLRATGLDDADIDKPMIAVVNTWSNVSPCNLHLRELAKDARAGIRAAGGTPIEFNTIVVTDGISMGTAGMRASLVSREVIADSIELAVNGHCLDAVVVLVRLRQDHSGRRDGAGADGYPGPGHVRRHDHARHARAADDHDPGRVRGRRRARRRQRSTTPN